MRKNETIIYAIISTLSLISITIIPAHSESASIKTKEALPKYCRLAVDDAHISTTMFNHTKLKYIKVKARSECYRYQSSVQLLLEIYRVDSHKKSVLVRPFDNYKSPKFGYVVAIEDAQILCVNNKPTKYYGVGKSHVVIPGLGIFDRAAQSQNQRTLPCGVS